MHTPAGKVNVLDTLTGSAKARFVQLFTDTDRSSLTPFVPATSEWLALQIPVVAAQPGYLAAAVAALLYRYTQQDTIALDLYGPGRPGGHPICLDIAVAGTASIAQTADAADALISAAKADAVDPDEPANVAVTFVRADSALPAPTVAQTTALPAGAAYDVHFVFEQASGGSRVALVYHAGLFETSTVKQIIESLGVMLAGAQRSPATEIDRLAIVGPDVMAALKLAQNGGTAASPCIPVHRLFEALANKQPTAMAAVFGEQTITYRSLDERSSRMAHDLVARGTVPGAAIAVCLRPCLEILVAILAIWKARAIYLPLDPTHPAAHIGRMLDEARPSLILTTSDLAVLTGSTPRLLLEPGATAIMQFPAVAPLNDPQLDDGAVLFYTSGTTGRPKGAVLTHGNLRQYVQSAVGKYGFQPQDIFASLARYTFSISLFELLCPLCCGASVHILSRDDVLSPERLFGALESVTVLHAGPSLLGTLFRYLRSGSASGRTLPRMRHASSGGDIVAGTVMEDMQVFFPAAELFVIYGCTEVSCMGTTYAISRDGTITRTFVGRPFPNVTLRVVDTLGALVPFGVVGEICFAGPGVVPGYLDRPDLTAEKFVDTPEGRYYRTGDVGRLHADGKLEILGRRDFQVKIRGMRIELAGIEKVVLELGLATQCAVVARSFGPRDCRLVAFAVGPRDPAIAPFRRAIGAELPEHMVPHHLVVLDAMPLTANGKLDRKRLQDMPLAIESEVPANSASGPDDALAQMIAKAFASVLRRADIPRDVSFFDLGGDSLLGVAVLEEIRLATGIAVPPGVLFESGTVQALADQIRSGAASGPKPILLNSKVPGTPLFMLSGVHIYRELARRLDGHCPAYGVFTQRELGSFDSASREHSVRELARDYLDIIRAEQAAGPYRLLGYSFAGLVAYEVAQQIRARGEEVSLLALVDAYLPEWLRGWTYRLDQISRLSSAPTRDVFNFVLKKLGGKRFAQDLAGQHENDPEIAQLERRRNRINLAAAAQYMAQLTPYDGRIDLIVSSTRLQDDPLKDASGGWSPYVRQLDIQPVNAHHLRMISEEPHVSAVAGILAKRI